MQLSIPIVEPGFHPPTLPIDQIAARAEAAGTNLKALAKGAGLAPSTAYRGAQRPAESRRSTEEKLTAALIAHERSLLAHLLSLHGKPKEGAR